MNPVLTGTEMNMADHRTIAEHGVPALVLMERAALACMEVLEEHDLLEKRIGIVCGSGNNGGDGLALARLLHLRGCKVLVYLLGKPHKMTEEAAKQLMICRSYQVKIAEEFFELSDCQVLIDAVFGVGLSRKIIGSYADVIREMNTIAAIKLAVDIPSGISADDGVVQGIALQADMTVTFSYAKVGQLVFPGKAYCGTLYVKDIGITAEDIEEKSKYCCCTADDLTRLPKVAMDAYKGSRGKVLCIAGSHEMGGAAYLAGHAALVAGCGMVQIYTPVCNRDLILTRLPEALVTCYATFREEQLRPCMDWADVIAIGPGLGTQTDAVTMLAYVLKHAKGPVILDADGLTILADHLDWLKDTSVPVVVTPHMGEMSRLCSCSVDELKEHKLEACERFAKTYDVVCVLKDAACMTAIPGERLWINPSGNAGMATAGSGDVLTGIIAGLAAQGLQTKVAAPFGVYLHGLAGDRASEHCSQNGMTASDLICGMKRIWKERGM